MLTPISDYFQNSVVHIPNYPTTPDLTVTYIEMRWCESQSLE